MPLSNLCFFFIIIFFLQVLDTTQNHKIGRKVEEALRRISVGLQRNTGLSAEGLLLFIHGIVSNTLLQSLDQKSNARKKQVKEGIVREDIFIVPAAPGRSGKLPALNKQTNEHIMIEFGLQMLHTSLKRQRFAASNPDHVRMLDPFVQIVSSSINSKYNKAVVLTVRSISFLIKFPLPSIKDSIPVLAKDLFKILKKYAKTGAGKGENFELVLASFKTMTTLIRGYKNLVVTNKQLRILLAFVEEDIYDSTRQSTALPLLKAILTRKLMVPEIHDVIAKISELSVRDSNKATRLQCRHLMLQYLLDYPLGKKIVNHLDFYVSHLRYVQL